MQLVVVTPEGVVCRAEVESVKLSGTMGQFTVLNNHAPLLSTLERGDVIYVEGGVEHHVSIRRGVVNVFDNCVEVCAEMDTPEKRK